MMQVTKGMARKLFNEGQDIMVMPDRLKPSSYTWKQLATWVHGTGKADEFGKLCELVSFYNCNPKNGMELVFYTKEV